MFIIITLGHFTVNTAHLCLPWKILLPGLKLTTVVFVTSSVDMMNKGFFMNMTFFFY